ncbi:formate/nitrite transporter family protein [Ornithinibacillus californiensis]|uniref:hypothetical protein n=1 Tax=Ornithinibacillus californiensis TaxID=161536 RepID=UPI00064DB4F7|nr:hypothetical protein [Ornithinibacillus californiensis]
MSYKEYGAAGIGVMFTKALLCNWMVTLGADITLANWWVWNQVIVTLGNLLSGFLFTGLALHLVTKEPVLTELKTQKSAS